MALASRLDRLALMDAHMEALPDLPAASLTDDDSDGGVELLSEQALKASTDLEVPSITGNESHAVAVKDMSFQASVPLSQHPDHKLESEPPKRLPGTEQPSAASNTAGALVLKDNTKTEGTPKGPSTSLPRCTLDSGALASPSQVYSPILAVSKYPYLFVERRESQRVASAVFDEGKFWERGWDLYYVWPTDGSKPLILTTEDQVQALLDHINRLFPRIGAKITDADREQGLAARFPNHPRLTPRYLGRISSKAEFDKMSAAPPGHRHRAPGEGHAPPPDERTLEAFKEMIEDMVELSRGKNKAKREKQKKTRQMSQQNMAKQLKRAQRYLGLRPKRPDIQDPLKDSSLSWEELQKAQANRKAVLTVPAHDPEQLCPWPCDASVIFICVDVEAWERDNSKITEVGISILDTLDLEGIAPGINGENWLSKIRDRHFIIREHSHLHNTEFVTGCVNAFEFGDSERISLSDAAQIIESCFRPPYSAPSDHPAASASDDAAHKRNLIFLGHDAGNDVRYLQKLGFNPLSLPNMLEILDTADMYRAWKREANPRSLGTILYEFDIAGWNLHNAGNDARYTLQCMMAIAVKEASLRGKAIAEQRGQDKAQRVVDAQNAAVERVREDQEGWSSAEEGDDGGAPVPVGRGAKPDDAKRKADASVSPQKTEASVPHLLVPTISGDRGGLSGRGAGGRGGWSDRGRGEHGNGYGRGRGNSELSRGGYSRGRGGNSSLQNEPRKPDYRSGFGRGRGGPPPSGDDQGNLSSDGGPLRGSIGRGRGRGRASPGGW
ncbi:hypothetical protein BU16DRAFT_533021 [Lophium mytilinum]|uniref:Gfd2/YDR514C-like C-terminal domain-containing protein n=1 Tax=Lophium mytilinum TaxID=390894 RepID=A0A6A6RDP6_9PEZI|nr:hypothetical protein BU16DRAFT_533021 [Lophium mytilinum]